MHPADENTTPVARKRFQRRVLQKEEQEEGVKAPVPVRPTAPARKESPERTAPRHAPARSRAPSDASGSGSLDSTGSCEGGAHVCTHFVRELCVRVRFGAFIFVSAVLAEGLVHIPTRPGVHLAILGNIKFEVSDRYTLHKIVGKGSYGAVAYVM